MDKKIMSHTLKVLAVSAPDWISGKKGDKALNSRDPVSVYNAMRVAAQQTDNPDSCWSNSNWALPNTSSLAKKRQHRRDRTLLMYSLDDMEEYRRLLMQERPNLLIIGCMTICFPGAIACAKEARKLLGDTVFIVLGGRHVNETIFVNPASKKVEHLKQSPVKLMENGKIEKVFDLCASGDGEYLITGIGESIGRGIDPYQYLSQNLDLPGNWIASFIDKNKVSNISSLMLPIDYSILPSPSLMFGVRASFDVFGGLKTAHLFSDIGRGCVYNCHFCSERRDVTGKPRMLETSYSRLYRQMSEASEVIYQDYGEKWGSGFVEDSVFLGGSPNLLYDFANLMGSNPLFFRYGGQFTIDQILNRKDALTQLKPLGLDYIFIGLETFDPNEIGGMSKDVGYKKESWVSRCENALSFMSEVGIKCGAAVLFGLGESQKSRLALFDKIESWQKLYGAPFPVSMNWAVQHPLASQEMAGGHDYTEWGTPEGDFLEIFHDFGEASLLYPIHNIEPPSYEELKEIHIRYNSLSHISSNNQLME